jgi:hypothetical protein
MKGSSKPVEDDEQLPSQAQPLQALLLNRKKATTMMMSHCILFFQSVGGGPKTGGPSSEAHGLPGTMGEPSGQ